LGSFLHVCAAAIAALLTASPALAQSKPDEDEIPSAPPARAQAPAIAPAPATPIPDVEAMRRELADVRARLDAAERRSIFAALGEGFSLTAYLQAQYESHQDSDDQLRQGGAILNQDRFLVRRARVRLDGEWEYAATAIEFEGNTTRGMTFGLRKAEASLRYRASHDVGAPFVMATVGLFDTPFGYELVESPRSRPFMERSTASRSMFPGEPDLGVRFAGGVGFFRWSAAAVNGEPLDEKGSYPAQDPNAAKDVVVRFGVDARPRDELRVTGGVSALRGKGFHAGTDATKSTIEWRDLNEDGVIQNIELTPIPGAATTPSSNFDRWEVGADLQLRYESRFGHTLAYGEVAVGNNMDRGLFPSDPVLLGIDTRQLGWYAGFHHHFQKWALVGFRYDVYEPNADVFDKRGGKLIPFSQKVTTISPLIGFVVPHAKLLLQYDVIDNRLARDPVGVPTKLRSNTLTLRLQVEL
jgi:hypothetical protein